MNKHAYLIIAHNNFYILEKLLLLIDDERNDIFLHIDKKVKGFNFDYFKSLLKFSNLYFVNRINIGWGSFSMIEAELNLYKSAINVNYKYYHLLSGVDLPIKSQNYIHDFFEKNNGIEFLTCLKDEFTEKQNIVDRISKYYLFQQFGRSSKFVNIANEIFIKIQKLLNINRYNNNFKIYYGSNWASLTHKSVEFLISQEKFIYDNFKYTLCCDEVYKQTTLMKNEKIKANLYLKEYNEAHVSYNMRHIDWKRGGPYIFKLSDYNELMDIYSLLARKFDEKVDKNIVDKIYNTLKAR